MADGSPSPLRRQSTKFHRTDDKRYSLALAAAVCVPALACWWQVSVSWSQRLAPALQGMLDKALAFNAEHPIVDEPGEAFAASAKAWRTGIDALQKSFRSDVAGLLDSGEVSSAHSVAAAVGLTIGLFYFSIFLPDASVFLSAPTKQALRLPLSAVNYVRGFLSLVACFQAWLLGIPGKCTTISVHSSDDYWHDVKHPSVRL